MTQKIQKLKNRIECAYLSEPDKLSHEELEKEIFAIENEVDLLDSQNYEDNYNYEEVTSAISDLRKAIRKTKIDRFMYDEEVELDLMFPNRHDEDFDEDSMYDV